MNAPHLFKPNVAEISAHRAKAKAFLQMKTYTNLWAIGWHDDAAGRFEAGEFATDLNAASARRAV